MLNYFSCISGVICLSISRSFFDCPTDLRVSLPTWYVCQQVVQQVWRLFEGLWDVSGRQAVPGLSQWTLPGEWSVCGGVSKVLLLFYHFLTCTWMHTIITHQWYIILSSLCPFSQGVSSRWCMPAMCPRVYILQGKFLSLPELWDTIFATGSLLHVTLSGWLLRQRDRLPSLSSSL